MKLPPPLHRWKLTFRQASTVQRRLAGQVARVGPGRPVRFVAGLDAAFSPDGKDCIAAAVVWDVNEGAITEQQWARRHVWFPYVPGYLSFREAPALLAALRRLRHPLDVLLCDGQGVAHPRRFGIASHLGVLTNLPSIGCAKSVLVGKHVPPGQARGQTAPIWDKGEIVGRALRTQDGIKPVYISIGHQYDLHSACRLVLACALQCRLPEPTRLADLWVGSLRRTSTTRIHRPRAATDVHVGEGATGYRRSSTP